MRSVLILVLTLFTTACANMGQQPVYGYRLVAFGVPATEKQQAIAICEPRAELAARRARDQQQEAADRRSDRNASISCNASFNGPFGNATCTKQKSGGGFIGGVMQAQAERNVQDAYTQTHRLELSSCYAEFGYSMKTECVSNCPQSELASTPPEPTAHEGITPASSGSTVKLGIHIGDLTPSIARSMKTTATKGIYITQVIAGGVAEHAGLKPKDIILSIGNRSIGGVKDLADVLASIAPGSTVQIMIDRDGFALEKTVQF